MEARIITVGRADRSICAVVRAEAGVWSAFPVLGHDDDTAALAAAIDRSPALAVAGAIGGRRAPDPVVGPADVREALRRIVVPWGPIDWPAPGPMARVATALDLEPLTRSTKGSS